MKYSIALITFILLTCSLQVLAQDNAPVEMADTLRRDGKIYTVVAGLVVILTGFVVFLIRVDRKLHKLEEEVKQK
jgi:uncharacterized membrane protein (DUF4010 family)